MEFQRPTVLRESRGPWCITIAVSDEQMTQHLENPRPTGGKRALDGLVRAERLMQIAFILPCAVVAGWILGYLLDRWLHQHWIYLPGLLLGCVAGFIEVFHIVSKNEKDSQ